MADTERGKEVPPYSRLRKRDIAACAVGKIGQFLSQSISQASQVPTMSSTGQPSTGRRTGLRWLCPACASVNPSDIIPSCERCGAEFLSLLVDPLTVCLPARKEASLLSSRAASISASGIAAGTVMLGPAGFVAATVAATSVNVTNMRFKESIRCEDVRLRLQAQTASEPWRDVRGVVRCGGGLSPEESAFLVARTKHVSAYLDAFVGPGEAKVRSK